MNGNIYYSLLSAVLVVMLFACEPPPDLRETFLIRSGSHYAQQRMSESLQNRSLKFRAMFDESAIYTFDDEGMQTNKNKLLGFSDCNSLHHENSARFAWQWFNNKLEIFAYCYVSGMRIEKYVGSVQLNQFSEYEIVVTEQSYLFYLDKNDPVVIDRGSNCNVGLFYILWPYFGGTLRAPHDIRIVIERFY